MEQNIHNKHRERLRERFTKEGLDSFSEINALELLLFFCLPRIDTNPIAHELLGRFGSFAGVLDAPVEELKKVKGIGDNLYLHNNGMLAVIDSLVNVIENEDTAALNAFLSSLCEMYKTKNLDITCYREFNSKSMYKCNMEDKEMYLENIGYDYLDKYCDISYNYVNVILPLVRLFL